MLSSMLGVGGGFLLVPIMIYILGMPARLVAGTSLFVMIFIMIVVTFLHAINHNSVDIFLVLILVVGSGIGAQLGTKISIKLKGEELRAMMSLLVLIFGFKFGYDLFFNKLFLQQVLLLYCSLAIPMLLLILQYMFLKSFLGRMP